MKRMALALSALLATMPAAAQTPSDAGARLKALYDREWTWRLEQGLRSGRGGEDDGIDRLPRVDAATQSARLTYWTAALAELDRIPVDQLSPDERIDAAVFRQMITNMAQDVRYRVHETPFNSDSAFWGGLVPRAGLRTAAAYRNYIARMRDLPRYFDEQIANMRAGLKRGFSIPRVTVTGRDATMTEYLSSDRKNGFFAPFATMPSTIPAAEQNVLRSEAENAIRSSVAPAYATLQAFIRDEYVAGARATLAAEKVPDGKAFYAAQIRSYTTLDLSAEQIHRIGLSEVARILAEMEAVKTKAGFAGDMQSFLTFLKTDEQFKARTPRELLSYSAYIAKKVDAKLGETIGFLPRRRFAILPVPDAIAPIYTAGRGGLDSCLMNTYDLPSRPLYNLAALTIHECNPGHSFQAAIAQEAIRRPEFRRQTYFSGYGEGWGLYTEWLGTKMGIYETPYEDFGRLSYEMWRAVRLVIDTGIHHYGWSRERAQAYLRDHTALSEREVVTEVDRYISWPGQALAYKLGEMVLRRKRAEAEAKLGSAFDQRAFHDAILALGSVPLPVLEMRLDEFIAAGGKNPPGWNPALPEPVK